MDILHFSGTSIGDASSSEEATDVALLELLHRFLVGLGDCEADGLSSIALSSTAFSLCVNLFRCRYSVIDN